MQFLTLIITIRSSKPTTLPHKIFLTDNALENETFQWSDANPSNTAELGVSMVNTETQTCFWP